MFNDNILIYIDMACLSHRTITETTMRLQLAIDVSNIDEAVDFYTKMFGVDPAKRKPGYANYEIAQPPLKLVLIENREGGGKLNHLGVETQTADEVVDAHQRLSGAGLIPSAVEDTTCCFADKTECWVQDPDGASWEWYVKTADSDLAVDSDLVAGPDPQLAEAPTESSGCCCS